MSLHLAINWPLVSIAFLIIIRSFSTTIHNFSFECFLCSNVHQWLPCHSDWFLDFGVVSKLMATWCWILFNVITSGILLKLLIRTLWNFIFVFSDNTINLVRLFTSLIKTLQHRQYMERYFFYFTRFCWLLSKYDSNYKAIYIYT